MTFPSHWFRPTIVGLLTFGATVALHGQQDISRVWIQFEPGSGDAVRGVLQRVSAEVHHDLEEIHAIAATVPTQAIQGLERNPNVTLIEEDPIREMYGQVIPYGIDMVQARQLWDKNGNDGLVDGSPAGAGIKVGVIDSGVWTGHEDFSFVPMTGNGLTGLATGWNQDACGHGTHVVGTIAAAANSVGVVGVAPGVSIHMVRVFGDDCGWAYSSTLVDAALRCKAANVRIISMSLGGGTKSATEEAAFQDLYNKGILCIAAAGNDGNTAYSYPASYASVVSVAAVDSAKAVADFSQKNDAVEVAAPGVAVLSTLPFTTAEVTVAGENYPVESMENSKLGSASGALANGGKALAVDPAWAGKVVLVERGDISFADKVSNVQQGGGVAAIIYNNAPGGFSGTLGNTTSLIPAVSLSREDGLVLLGKIGASASVNTHLPQLGNGYAYYDGTSMATPHVAGVAALIWSSNSALGPSQVRAALRGSAEDILTAGKDNASGHGIVRAKSALDYLTGTAPYSGADRSVPASTEPSVKTGKGGSFTISWVTDEVSDTIVTFTKPTLSTYRNATLVKSHSLSFRGSRGVTYEYTVSSSDAAGNMVTKSAVHKN